MDTIDRQGAWEIGLFSARVELRGDRTVWASEIDGDPSALTLQGRLADDITPEEFWAECREGLSK